jgi:hypothetical protein
LENKFQGTPFWPLFLVGLTGVAAIVLSIYVLVLIVRDGPYAYWRTRDQVTVMAQLRAVEYKMSGRRRHLAVSYDYEVSGRAFKGSRISLTKDDKDFYEYLSSALDSNTPIQVFIDPQHPEFSVIDREFRWWILLVLLLFPLVFSSFGIFFLRLVWWTRQHPHENLGWGDLYGRSLKRAAGKRR